MLCPFTSPTPLEKAPAGHLSQAPQVAPRDVVTVTRHVVESIVQSNAPYYDTACKVGGCTFSYEASNTIYHTVPSSNNLKSVSLFYWPSVAPNTDCLSTLPRPPIETPPPGLLMETKSVYVIFTSFYIFDGCGTKLAEIQANFTTSFTPDDLSTVEIASPAGTLTTAPFNFAQLPCPPPGYHVPALQPYRPILAPPPFLTDIPGWDPRFDDCDPGHGIDPPTALTTALGGVPGPELPGGGGDLPPRDVMRAEAHPYPHARVHVVPRAPMRTAAPAPA